jgi:hypothetical protein
MLLGSVGMSASADFQKGSIAYQSGDYATAYVFGTDIGRVIC